MNTFKHVLLILSIYLISYDRLAAQSNVFRLSSKGQDLQYRVTLPEGYDKSLAYPVLFAPGLEHSTDGYSIYLGDEPSAHQWIIVESIVHMKPTRMTKALIDQVRLNYPVSKLFISGFSANSLDIFRRTAQYVELIDGVIAMPGYANGISQEVIDRNPDLQIILIVGEKDSYWRSLSEQAHRRLQSMAVNSSLHIIDNGGHILDGIVGEPFFDLIDRATGRE